MGTSFNTKQNTKRIQNMLSLIDCNSDSTLLAKVKGDSMCNAGINSGDWLIVSKTFHPVDFNIVVASINGMKVVKRFLQHKNNIYLISENRNYPLIKIKHTDKFEILGEVVSVVKSV